MKILFTRGNTWFSRTICAVLCEPVSHVAVQCGDSVAHSNLFGVGVTTLVKFKETHETVYTVTMPDDPQKLLDTIARYGGSPYDFGALLFLGLCFAARRYLRLPLPKQNLWQSTGMFLCTEFATEVINGKEDSVVTPYRLFNRLVRRSFGEAPE